MQGNQQDMDVLRGWCAFVEATGLATSRVKEVDVFQEQQIKLSAANVDEDATGFSFSLSAVQTGVLEQRFVKNSTDGKTHADALQLGFPLLRVVEGANSFFVPLFRYSLPDNWHSQAELRVCVPVKQGVEVAPNIDAFRLYLDVDIQELGAQRHMMSLAAACSGKQGETFVAVFRTFLAWINHRLAGLKAIRNDVANVFLEKSMTALICPQIVSDFNIREQLKDYKALLKRPDLNAYPLLQHYITQRSVDYPVSRNRYSRFPYGLFETQYPLGRGQMETLMQVSSATPLVAVQGAPGTGKTTLFKSLIASQIVERALICIAGEDRNLGVVVTSTAKKAVENVIDDLRDDNCLKDFNWLYFLGGDRAQVSSEIERVQALLRQLDDQAHDKQKQKSVAVQITQIRQTIDAFHGRFRQLQTAFEDARSRLAGASPQIHCAHLETLERKVLDSSITLELIDEQQRSTDTAVLSSLCKNALEAWSTGKAAYWLAMDQLSRGYAKLIDAPFAESAYPAWIESTLSETLEHHFADYPKGFLASLRAWLSRRKYNRALVHIRKTYSRDVSIFSLDDLDQPRLAELARNRGDLFKACNVAQVNQTLKLGLPADQRQEALKLLGTAIDELTQRSSD